MFDIELRIRETACWALRTLEAALSPGGTERQAVGQSDVELVKEDEALDQHHAGPPLHRVGILMTVEQVAELLFGEIGPGGSSSSNCQKVRKLIPDSLPARRIGNRWFVHRAAAESWAGVSDSPVVMAHPDTRAAKRG